MTQKELDVLEGLGLTSTVARVYLALCHFGILYVKRISSITGIARQDIYRVTDELSEKGLVERIISRPISFRAVPIEVGVSFLLEQRHEELSTLESKTKSLVKNFKSNNKKLDIDQLLRKQCVLIPSKEAITHRLREAIGTAQTSLDTYTSLKRFRFGSYRLAEDLQKAWSRGVRGRAIIDDTEKLDLDVLKTYWNSPSAEIKFVHSKPKTAIGIFDKKEVLVYMEPNTDFGESSALLSYNPSVVAMAVDYFEMLWMKATESSRYPQNITKTTNISN